MESQPDLVLQGLFQPEDQVSHGWSSLQGWLSTFSSCSQGRTLVELCEASRERRVSGSQTSKETCSKHPGTCLDTSKSTGAIPAALASTEQVNMKVFCLQLHKGCVRLPGAMSVTPRGASCSGPQFAFPDGDKHLCPKGGWRLGNVCKSLSLRRHPVLWCPRRPSNSRGCRKLTVHPSASFYFSSHLK